MFARFVILFIIGELCASIPFGYMGMMFGLPSVVLASLISTIVLADLDQRERYAESLKKK